MENPMKEQDAPETLVEQNELNTEPSPHDTSLVTEVKEKPYHPIFPGMDVEKPEATHTKVPTLWLLAVLILVFFVIKKFLYIPDGDRDGK